MTKPRAGWAASPPTVPILSGPALVDLLSAHPPREMFGPDSSFPAIAFHLAGADSADAAMLGMLPCPVIGIGHGRLAEACDTIVSDEVAAALLIERILRAPVAAMILVQHLRASEGLPVTQALVAESMAYATVQMGPEFRRWQGRRPAMPAIATDGPPLLVTRDGGLLALDMNRPGTRNAIDVEMRDALCAAMDLALADPTIGLVRLTGAGRCFSVGGDIREFGEARDPATAHWVRSLRLPAARAALIADRLEARITGAAIGAGIEIAAFARHVVATSDAWFQLPELDYGLIPGAGGTVSVTRRIGRHRAVAMMLSGRRVRAPEALTWGLIDAIED
ncbi:enoyl-CoA hydratase/isomerase family protein [Sphingobium sp. AP49]|uniref:enoyl-CoA hydratase/isomerase family protein n=1 Tax=Sphingobium sp. AP49 TaxID=1144307 RepID=UPI00026ED8D1|nr:enoyl-CoA hydratase/isomerase family protein [Sphingobium sp. AP49]WHO37276.1 enoyl-CoA hydratase/isomerase family protein [Sphingobium sp. AP49]